MDTTHTLSSPNFDFKRKLRFLKSYWILQSLMVEAISLCIRVVSFHVRNKGLFLHHLIIVVLTKVRFVLMMMLNHLWQQFVNMLLTFLRSNNVLVEFVCLNFHDNFRYCSFEIESCCQCSVSIISKLLFSKFDAHNRLQLVFDLRLSEHNVSIDNTEFHLVELLYAVGLSL